jgi:hypothetical protein
MTPFATFAALYMTAVWLELAEHWNYPLFTLAVLIIILLTLLTPITRITFLVFLAVTTSQFLVVQFPEVANHVNVEIYCNLVMMIGIIYSLARSRDFATDDDWFAMMRPVIQTTAILMYFLAGFHKLNADFFDPDVSCVADLLGKLSAIVGSEVAGVPTALILAVGIIAVTYRLLSVSPLRRYRPVAAGVGAIGLIAVAALLVLKPAPEIPPPARLGVILAMAGIVISWELVGGLLLAVPRLQAPVVAFSWMMHSTLVLIGFVDFGALALALLYTFVPRPYLDLLNQQVRIPVTGRVMHRVRFYFAISVLSGMASGLNKWVASGLLFLVAELVLVWPVLASLVSPPPRPAWGGVPLSSRMTPRWMFIFPVLLLLHGFTPYVGLRTAGNFSMFSNLRTEGATSNHFLLGSNPLKIWSYQEDVVRFIAIDDGWARIGYGYVPLKSNRLPVVEFRKLIYKWTRAGRKVPLTFEYRGKIHSTRDIVHDPLWRTDTRNWEMALMDFRVIQPEGSNQCRW